MLETLYNYFGFVGSILFALFVFLFVVFWLAGVAGICMREKRGLSHHISTIFAILVPVYPVLWLIIDMIKQKRELKRL